MPRMSLMLVLDPDIFRDSTGWQTLASIENLKLELKRLIGICRDRGLRVVFDRDCWRDVEINLIRSLKDVPGSTELSSALSILRKNFLELVQVAPPVGGRTWGVLGLFPQAGDARLRDCVAKSLID